MSDWKDLKNMTYLGKPYTRVDGMEKVTGKARYAYDIKLPGMLYARILKSPHPHAKIKNIDDSKVKALSGVVATLTDIKDEIFFAGDDVAAVAATSEEIAEDAIELFDVEYEILPFVVDEKKAQESDAPKVFSNRDDNLGRKRENSNGDINRGFAEADVVIERTFHMNAQVHTTLETHGCIAKWENDELFLWESTQGVHPVKSAIAKHFDMPENKVHVECQFMGGGFGSKLGIKSYDTICARLAKKAGAPVKLMLTREADFVSSGNRPSSFQTIKIGAKKDGTLTAFQMDSFGTGGIGGGAGVPQPYIYQFPNFKVVHQDVHINAGPGAPFRAPGHPQANFAMESIMDELAEKLNMDPLELRQKNDPNTSRQNEYKIGAEKFGWTGRDKTPKDNGRIKRGYGLGSGRWGGGGNKRTQAIVSIFPDGAVEVKIGTQDLGTGTRTYVASVAAEELGLEIQDVTPKIGNSDYPWAPNSGGSTTAPSTAPTIKRATAKAKQKLMEIVAGELGVQPDDLEIVAKTIQVKGNPDNKLSWKKACALLEGQPISEMESWAEGLSDRGTAGCQFAEVQVDTETGEVKVVRMIAVQDCGLVLNMLTAKNQVNGAIIGEIGYVLYENRILDPEMGIMVNTDMENYKIPGALESPEFDITMYDESERGVIGLGEPPVIPGNGAIANAIADAVGIRFYELPITPDKVLLALEKAKEGKA